MRIHQISQNIESHQIPGQLHSGRTGVSKQRAKISPFHQYLRLEEQTQKLRFTAPMYELHVPIIMVRHGQTNGNINGQFQGQIDEADHALNAVGREQVRQGAQRVYATLRNLLNERLTDMLAADTCVLRHSPLSRARDTAQAFIDYVAEQTGVRLSAIVEKRLSEMDFGVVEGCTIADVAQDPALYAQACRYRAEDASVDWNGTGESFVDVVLRVHEWLDAINTEYTGRKRLVIAFAHGVTINALRTLFYAPEIVDERGVVSFRKHFLDNAAACWLGNSHQLAERISRA